MSENIDYEDMVDGVEDDVYTGEQDNGVQSNGVVQEEDVQPVHLSKGKTFAIVIIFILLVIFVLKVMDGVSFSSTSNIPTQTSEVQLEGNSVESSSVEKGGDVSSQQSENSAVSGEVSSTSSEEINNANNVGNTQESGEPLVKGEIVNQKETQVTEEQKAEFEHMTVQPSFGTELTVSGVVKGISMYRVGESYTYGVNLVLVTGTDTVAECTYFCPKKTADALVIGDSLYVSYVSDSIGNICVTTISKQ